MLRNNIFDGLIGLIRAILRWERKNELREMRENPEKWMREHFPVREPDPPLFTRKQNSGNKQKLKKPSVSNPSITLIKTPEEDHAYHFKALMNLNYTNRDLIYEIAKAAIITKPIKKHENTAIRQLSFQENNGNVERVLLRVITVNDEQEAVFPYLKTGLKIPFRTEKIIEWDIDDPVEAEIEGTWDGVASLGFFASDYAVNKHIYNSKKDIDLRLSAFIIDIHEIEVEEYDDISNIDENEVEKDDIDILDRSPNKIYGEEVNHIKNVCEYWPNVHYGKYSYFDFEALVLDINKAGISKYSTGRVLRLKITDNKQISDLTIDAYITYDNNAAQSIKKDIHILGTLWFQGELAE